LGYPWKKQLLPPPGKNPSDAHGLKQGKTNDLHADFTTEAVCRTRLALPWVLSVATTLPFVSAPITLPAPTLT